MVLPEARTELREAFAALIAGETSNDAFDVLYHERFARSPDRAVAEIGAFGFSLYSSDLFGPYYLIGRHRVSDKVREMAERCDLFLRSELEYEWPVEPRLGWVQLVQGLVIAPGCLVSLFAGALAALALANRHWSGVAVLTLIAGVAVLPGAWVFGKLNGHEKRRWEEFWRSGDRQAWPFLTEADWRQARERTK